jgi:hypothetical protein
MPSLDKLIQKAKLKELQAECRTKAYSRQQKFFVKQMFSPTGCLLPLKGEKDPNTIRSFNALCARLINIPGVVISQLDETTDYACFRINNPYLGTFAQVFDPKNPIRLTDESDIEIAELEEDDHRYYKEALGDLYDPEDFEPSSTMEHDAYIESCVEWRLKCLHCPTLCELVEEEYINIEGRTVAICNSCRAKGIQPTNQQLVKQPETKPKKGFRW